MENWVDSVPPHVASSNGTYNSELDFLVNVRKALDSIPNSPVDLINTSKLQLLDYNLPLVEQIGNNSNQFQQIMVNDPLFNFFCGEFISNALLVYSSMQNFV